MFCFPLQARAVEELQETQNQMDSLLDQLTSLTPQVGTGSGLDVPDVQFSQPEGAVESHTERLQVQIPSLRQLRCSRGVSAGSDLWPSFRRSCSSCRRSRLSYCRWPSRSGPSWTSPTPRFPLRKNWDCEPAWTGCRLSTRTGCRTARYQQDALGGRPRTCRIRSPDTAKNKINKKLNDRIKV